MKKKFEKSCKYKDKFAKKWNFITEYILFYGFSQILYRFAFIMGSADTISVKKCINENDINEEYGQNLKLLPCNDQVKELQTILRDK